jgi:hypothetical protein
MHVEVLCQVFLGQALTFPVGFEQLTETLRKYALMYHQSPP